MSAYYPSEPFRRFWYMRGRLFVAELETSSPSEAPSDQVLFELHTAAIASAGDDPIHIDERGMKGFVYRDQAGLMATVRWRNGDLDDEAKASLLDWAKSEGRALSVDESFADRASAYPGTTP